MDSEFAARLVCPSCRADSASLDTAEDALRCSACGRSFAVKDGLPVLVPEESPLAKEMGSWGDSAASGGTSSARQREYWESELGHRGADHPVVAGFARQRWDHLATLLPLQELRTALDVGAGNGFSTLHAPAHLHMTATDGSFHMLRRHPSARKVLADAKSLPFRSKSFDLAYCWELLHHVDEPHLALREMARVSRRYVYVFEPNPMNAAQAVFAVVDREHRWVLRYSRRYLLDQFEQAGLEPIAHQHVGVVFPNKTPNALYPLLARVPFRLPWIGISHLVIARVRDGADSNPS